MMAVGDNSEGRSSARAYLEEQSALVRSGGYWNCLAAARELSALLLAEGRSPWIARLRRTEVEAGRVFHAPLIPRGPGVKATWTTHYVCCCEGMAYDPVAGKPTRLEAYSLEVFGEQISLEVFVPAVEISDYLERPRARPPSSRP
ncbi:MAG: hypothetical protein DMF67_18340 [Acidobacteria bacterium]|nr:MAG: hypothetical protein DMF67_18340 [Acidobacteriota bacterium]